MFEQRIIDNDDERFPDQILIAGYQDGVEVWRSWLPAEIDPAVRLNIDLGPAADERSDTETTEVSYRVPSTSEARLLDISPDQHRVVATYAAVVEAVSLSDAATACELPEQALIEEAQGWAAAS